MEVTREYFGLLIGPHTAINTQTSEVASHSQAAAFDVKVSDFAETRSVLVQEDPSQATKVIAAYSS